MAGPVDAAQYVWRRSTDREPSGWVWWIIACVVALSGFGAFAAFMADNGQISTFIVLGAIASMLVWLVPRMYHWARVRNPDILMDGREMVWAKTRVPIDQVERWSAALTTQSFSNGTTTSRTRVGVVEFTMLGGDQPKFTFTHLTNAELAELTAAIDPILPGRRIG